MRYLKVAILSIICIIYLGGCAKNTLPDVESTSSTSAEPSASTSHAQTPTPVPEETAASEETTIPLNELISADDLTAYFGEYNVATMLMSDGVSQVTYNEPLSAKRYSPYSTFKIVNSLISLEERAVSIDDSVRKWDGRQYSLPNFNQDQDMASAMKFSCVWYHKQLAREVGKTAMQNYLNEIGYGNMDISGGIDMFWLSSSLLISPQEQLDLITRLYNNELSFSQVNMEYVNSIMRQEDYSVEIYGKTGSSGKGHGWFVGYAILNEKPYYFATYIEGENVDGPLARDKTAEILSELFSEI